MGFLEPLNPFIIRSEESLYSVLKKELTKNIQLKDGKLFWQYAYINGRFVDAIGYHTFDVNNHSVVIYG